MEKSFAYEKNKQMVKYFIVAMFVYVAVDFLLGNSVQMKVTDSIIAIIASSALYVVFKKRLFEQELRYFFLVCSALTVFFACATSLMVKDFGFIAALFLNIIVTVMSGYSDKRLSIITGVMTSVVALITGILYGKQIYGEISTVFCVILVASILINTYIIIRSMKELDLAVKERDSINEENEGNKEMVLKGVVAVADKIDMFGNGLNSKIASVGKVSDGVVSNFAQITNASSEISGNIGNVSESVIEIAKTLNDILDNSKVMRELADQTKDAANRGNGIVGSSVEEMGNVSKIVDETMQITVELSSQMEKVFEILTTINGISSQTNLLSLNASIEAARAGDAGRGFAVVATEIRKLAEGSKESTKHIESILNYTKAITEKVNASMTKIEKAVGSSVSVNGKVLEGFKSINENSENVKKKAAELEKMNFEATQHAKEISKHLETVSASSQEMTASSQEILSSLSKESEMLKEVIDGSKKLGSVTNELSEIVSKIK